MAVKLPVHAVASRSLRPKLGGRAGDYFVGTFEFCYFVRHKAAKEMRVGPSKSACRGRLQTTKSCVG